MKKNVVKHNLLKQWNVLKEKIHLAEKVPKITNGDVWWCSFGENIGVEINGKSSLYSRPVVVYKKLGRFSFMGIPLTSQLKEGTWYVPFNFKSKRQIAVLSQARAISTFRLQSRIGKIDELDFQQIKSGFLSLYK